jgi:F0F1-type ATP synthase membrane subunit b/b'
MKICIYCDYEAKTNWNFKKHIATAKHKENEETYINFQNKFNLCCWFCKEHFDTENDKLLHINICSKNKQNEIIISLQNENTDLKKKLEQLQKENEKIKKKYESTIKKLNKEHTLNINNLNKEHTENIAELTKDHTEHVEELYKTSNKTLETIAKLAIKEIRQKYPDAPLLERMNNEIVNQIMNDLFRKGDDDYKMCSRILFFYKDKQLVNLISEAILSYYKKLDPKDQAFWNTDTARLNYIIKDTVDDKESWVIDKFGVKMKNLVIAPLGDELRNYIFEHKNVLCKNSLDRNNNSFTIQKLQEEINICFDIMFFVDEKKFEYSICKTMAPKMYYNSNVSTKAICNG